MENTNSYKNNFVLSFNEDPNNKMTIEDYNNIILTRLITSGISVLACFICIVIYFGILIKKTIQTKKEIRQKVEKINQLANGEDLDEIDENNHDKNERFLTCENMEEEKIENKINNPQNRHSSITNKEGDGTVSFENVVEQNKSVDIKKNVFR